MARSSTPSIRGLRARERSPRTACPTPRSRCSTSRRTARSASTIPPTGAARAARAPHRLPLARGDRERARLDRCAARRRHRAHARRPPDARRPARRRRAPTRGGEERNVVAFEWVDGAEPPEDRLVEDFEELGAITARLHLHARAWQRPAGFTRFVWDYDTSLGANGHWGRWQDGIGSGPDGARGPRPLRRTSLQQRLDRVRHRARPVRPGARRHAAGQPPRRRRQRHA